MALAAAVRLVETGRWLAGVLGRVSGSKVTLAST